MRQGKVFLAERIVCTGKKNKEKCLQCWMAGSKVQGGRSWVDAKEMQGLVCQEFYL